MFQSRELTPIQQFGLVYSLLVEERDRGRDEENRLRSWSAVLNPIRFREVFLPTQDEEFVGEEVTPDDFTAIDKFLRELDQTKTMRGS